MAARNPGSLKRQKELARQQRQREKKAERDERKAAKENRPKPLPGEDPDIAGIVPGPQPRLDDDYPAPEEPAEEQKS